MEQIGNEKIEKIVSEIRHRSQVLQDECIDDSQQMINDEGVIWPTLKENRATNITCWTSTRGLPFKVDSRLLLAVLSNSRPPDFGVRTIMTGRKDSKIRDGKDVDVLRGPANSLYRRTTTYIGF